MRLKALAFETAVVGEGASRIAVSLVLAVGFDARLFRSRRPSAGRRYFDLEEILLITCLSKDRRTHSAGILKPVSWRNLLSRAA